VCETQANIFAEFKHISNGWAYGVYIATTKKLAVALYVANVALTN
jgi:hypothetical protein